MAEKIVKDSQCLVNDLATDCISRRAAIEALEKIDCSDGVGISSLKCDAVDDAVTAIKVLPSAQPERKRGKWIDYANSHCECSVCHTEWSYFQNEVECFEFCPNCGADMREVDVDERPD